MFARPVRHVCVWVVMMMMDDDDDDDDDYDMQHPNTTNPGRQSGFASAMGGQRGAAWFTLVLTKSLIRTCLHQTLQQIAGSAMFGRRPHGRHCLCCIWVRSLGFRSKSKVAEACEWSGDLPVEGIVKHTY